MKDEEGKILQLKVSLPVWQSENQKRSLPPPVLLPLLLSRLGGERPHFLFWARSTLPGKARDTRARVAHLGQSEGWELGKLSPTPSALFPMASASWTVRGPQPARVKGSHIQGLACPHLNKQLLCQHTQFHDVILSTHLVRCSTPNFSQLWKPSTYWLLNLLSGGRNLIGV